MPLPPTGNHNQEPPWAHAPSSHHWKLIEIKGGVEVGSHALDKACIVLGRCAEEVDIELRHESCSRRHARIAFDSRGFPWLRDLQSTHGTFVNKKALPKEAIGKIESNSTKKGARGVVLYVGDVVAFGASTRIYSLEGPPEFERGSAQAALAMASAFSSTTAVDKRARQQSESKDEPDQDDSGVSWGMDVDDPSEQQIQDTTSSIDSILETYRSDPSKIPKSMYRLFEKLSQRKAKLENLHRESERIRQKGTTHELSQGQTNQLERNDSLQRRIMEEIGNIEEEILEMTSTRKSTGTTRRGTKRQAEDDDVDDFYDKTIQRDTKDVNQEVESESTLIEKWKKQYSLMENLMVQLSKHQHQVESVRRRLDNATDEDAFFVQNELSLSQEQLDKTTLEQKRLEKAMSQTERWLQVANSELVCDRMSGKVGVKSSMPVPPSSRGETFSMPPPSSGLRDNPSQAQVSSMPPPPGTLSNNTSSMLPPPNVPNSAATQPGTLSNNASSMLTPPNEPNSAVSPAQDEEKASSTMQPPLAMSRDEGTRSTTLLTKKRRTQGPSLPPDTASESRGKAPRNLPMMGTLAVLSAAGSKPPTRRHQKDQESGTSSREPTDPKKDVWRVPQGQDGSGMTKLNEKFKGRY